MSESSDYLDGILGKKQDAPVSSSKDYLDNLVGNKAAPQTPQAEGGSWWDRHGRTVEQAALAAITLAGGAKLATKAIPALTKAGPIGEGLVQTGRNIRAVVAPSTVDEASGRAAAAIRAEHGTAARQTAQAEARLEPEWGKAGTLDDPGRLKFIDYIEGRSKGARIPDPKLQKLADTIRDLYDEVHVDMRSLNQSQKAGFVEDYYRHVWKRNPASDRAFSKEGLKGFTKERSIPTIAEGIKLGLTPKSTDPVQTTLQYIDNAKRFIATNKILAEGVRQKDVALRQLGTKAPFPSADKWVRLEGSLAKRGGHELYAKEGWARVYNNAIASGFTGPVGELIQGLRRTSNTLTALELGLSGFHVTTMANEAVINDVAKSLMDISKGRAREALMGLIKSPTAPVRLYQAGKKVEQAYLGHAAPTPQMRHITNLLERAGGRGKGMTHARDYEYTAMGDFFKSWERGALAAEKRQYLQNIKQHPISGTVGTAASLIGRTMQTISKLLFEKYIPRLKNGAFYENMAQWLETNPGSSVHEQEKAARVIWDSIDNRFGELVQDNVFWKQHVKQLAMISMRSYSWNMGTVREIGGGAKDLASGQFTPRAAYTIALPIVYGTMSAIYQIFKTGKKPQDIQDLIAPQTGGVDARTGQPERLMMPGYMKDVFAWTEDPLQTISNKASTFITTGSNIARGRDWKGDPIAEPTEPGAPLEQTVPKWLPEYFGFVGENISPISIREFSKGRMEGSNISPAEQFMGLRPAGMRFTDPERYQSMNKYRAQKDWRKKLKYDAKQKAYRGVE
jgi:hypothetical protein